MGPKNRISAFMGKITGTTSGNPDTALMEYMTKTVLIVLTLVSASFSIISMAGWIFNIIPGDTVLILLSMNPLFITGWLLARHGYWRLGSLIPPTLIFSSAVYGNYIGGIDAPAMLLYVTAIILVAMLRGIRDMYWALFFSLASYLGLGVAHHLHIIEQMRSGKTVFMNRITVTISVITGITLLVRFLIIQFRKALDQARSEIRERRVVEEELRVSEKKYRDLVQSANSIIIRINMRGEVTFWNEFAESFFGFRSDEIMGRNVVGTIVPESDMAGTNLKLMMENILKNPESFRSNENENMTRDGNRVWIAWANRPILDLQGNFQEILCVGNDITERKRAHEEKEKMQDQLIHAQKMEAIGTLTSGLAHDFNNILSGIMGSLSLLDNLLKKETINRRDKSDNYIRTALESSRRASDMIRQLLLLSRKQDISLEPIDINESLSHVINICMNSFPKSITVNAQYSEKPTIVMADSILIEQIFLNFCVNASHSMTVMRNPGNAEGGDLTVTVSSAQIHEEEWPQSHENSHGGRFAAIEFSDTGIGMDKETQERIFEPFYTMKKNEGGTGLGLSIAYGFVSRLGGFIKVKSAISKGSTFTIFLPELSDKTVCRERMEAPKDLISGHGTILVIDDEPFVRDVAGDSLTSCGYEVITAHDGMSGISMYRERRESIDAVLLDISMPYMSGLEVLGKLKEINESVVVILSSGYSDDPRVSAGLEQGAAGFIRKPYTAGELSSCIYEILHKHR
ncbi:MAG: hypothetical protein CVV44_14110 [Spirochaetae bacterium HGW-Spirochaetae-1]|nr:MAG: hypothetical protein CVV44_14110 [Spirochaetae bacterium HGW-Spirochaetae-1]